MIAKPARREKKRQGAAAVEFALTLAVLMMLVFASIEFVRLNMLKQSVEHASYMAARKGIIVGAKTADVRAEAEQHLALFSVTNGVVTVAPANITDDTEVVEVTVEVPVSGNSWISPVYFSGSIEGKTRMLAERVAAEMAAGL
ncbi:MAG: TadE family protein [Planctomycetota bacterium]